MSIRDTDLIGCVAGVDLLDGKRIIGKVRNWSSDTIWLDVPFYKNPVDVPRTIIRRVLVCIKGGKE